MYLIDFEWWILHQWEREKNKFHTFYNNNNKIEKKDNTKIFYICKVHSYIKVDTENFLNFEFLRQFRTLSQRNTTIDFGMYQRF